MKLGAGIIGLGVGEAHIDGYRSHPDCSLVALCDFSNKKLSEWRKKNGGVRLTRRAEEILKDPAVHVVSIASYDAFHYEQIVEAVRNGKHVFVEKPVCLYEKELRALRRLYERHPRLKISSNLILRRSPRFLYLKSLVRKNVFGDLFFVEGDYNYGRLHKITDGWRGRVGFYSVVYGGAIHLVDLLLWLTGDTVEEVSAQGNRIASRGSRFRHHDFVAALLRFKSGLVGKVTANFGCVMPHYHGLVLYGTKATFVNGFKRGLLYTSRDPNALPRAIEEPYPAVRKGALVPDFIDSILKDREPEVSKEDLFRVMSVCLAIQKSAARGRTVKVKYF